MHMPTESEICDFKHPLKEYCSTTAQVRRLHLITQADGVYTVVEKFLGVSGGIISRMVDTIKKTAALRGHAPASDMTHTVPDGFNVKGTSTMYDRDGEVRLQWVKTQQDQAQLEALMAEAVKAMGESLPREKAVKRRTKKVRGDLVNLYTITDYHIGALAWKEETGAAWNTDVAENLLVKWFGEAIKRSPDAEVGLFAQLGDFLHFDGMEALTPANHNVLDADSRFQLLVRVVIRALRRIIKMLLKKHSKVHIIMAEGNHDPASSIWLREWLKAIYDDEPRVFVDVNPNPYYCYEHGKTSLFFHHGHKRTVSNIDDVFVSKFRDVFGRTDFSYAHMGHKHCTQVTETNLMLVEQHRTLAAPDAYASRGGWSSGRDAKVITYSKIFGEVGRLTISPGMLGE